MNPQTEKTYRFLCIILIAYFSYQLARAIGSDIKLYRMLDKVKQEIREAKGNESTKDS